MSQDEKDPVVFGEEFWREVYARAGYVRELAAAELINAEEQALGEEAEVLPLFTEPFWNGIHQRSERVRQLATQDLEAAESRLIAGKQVVHRPRRRLSPQVWARAQGFALALLATLALLPQIAPVLSWARIGSPDEEQIELEGISVPGSSSTQDSASGAAPAAEPRSSRGAAELEPSEPGKSGEESTPGGEDGSAGGESRAGAGSSGGPSGESGTTAVGADGVGALRSPDDVSVEAVNSTSLRISWTDRSSDEVGFELERETGDLASEQSRNVASNQTSFEWDELEPGSRACFRVRAVGGAAPSKWAPDTDRGYVCADLPLPPSPSPSPSASPEPSPSPSPTAASNPPPPSS